MIPLLLLGVLQVARKYVPEIVRKRIYFTCASFILIGVLAMRWNVVMGGQFFSKSLRGVMSYKLEFRQRGDETDRRPVGRRDESPRHLHAQV